MSNLYDLLPRDVGTLLGLEMLDVADRAGNTSMALEMIRNVSNRYIRNDSMLIELFNRTLRYTSLGENEELEANRDELRETRTFIKLMRNLYQARYCDDEQRKQLLMDFMQTTTLNPPDNIYDRIVLQHAVCTLLAQMGSSDLLSTKLDELGKLIGELRFRRWPYAMPSLSTPPCSTTTTKSMPSQCRPT